MLSLGVDLVEIARIRRSMENPRFLKRVLGEAEYAQLEARGFPPQSVAACFAAKEAFSKAVGTGLGAFSLREAELLHRGGGEPYLALSGAALALARGREFAVSVTHTRQNAAVVVAAQDAQE